MPVSPCVCCGGGGGGDTGNSNPCSGCCQELYAIYISVDAGCSVTGNIIDVSTNVVSPNLDDMLCGRDLAFKVTRLGGAGTKWQYDHSEGFGGSPVFQSVATNLSCPPYGDASAWVKSSGGNFVLCCITCVTPTDGTEVLPSTLTCLPKGAANWSGAIDTHSTAGSYAGPPNFSTWNGALVLVSGGTGSGSYQPDLSGDDRRSFLQADGTYIDFHVNFNYSYFGGGVSGGDLTLQQTFGYATIDWQQFGGLPATRMGMVNDLVFDSATGRAQLAFQLDVS
jgi:hypothetical protein